MRNIFFWSLWLLGIFFGGGLAKAQETQGLEQLLTPIRSLEANFTQTILDNRGKAVQKSEGKMALLRPGHFRWETLRPIPQLIIANHSKLWIYDPDLQQVVIRPLGQAAGQTPAFLLSNVTKALSDDFTVRSMAAPRDWQWYALTPKMKDSMYKVIELGFLKDEIKEMRMQDNLGHHTVIQFQHLRKNVSLSPGLFEFHGPLHVDVINEVR